MAFKRNNWANLASAMSELPRLRGRPGAHHRTPEEVASNRRALAVSSKDALPEGLAESEFFAPASGSQTFMSAEHIEQLNAMLEAHGLKNLLVSLQMLLEGRVEDGVLDSNFEILLHLSRHNAYARAAETIRNLSHHADVKDL